MPIHDLPGLQQEAAEVFEPAGLKAGVVACFSKSIDAEEPELLCDTTALGLMGKGKVVLRRAREHHHLVKHWGKTSALSQRRLGGLFRGSTEL